MAKVKTQNTAYKNPVEALGDLSRSTASAGTSAAKDISADVVNQFFGLDQADDLSSEEYSQGHERAQKTQESVAALRDAHEKKPLFNYVQHTESVTNQQEIRQLTEYLRSELKQSLKVLKRENAQFGEQVKEAEKIVMQDWGEDPTVYDLSFSELMVKLVRSLIQEVQHSRTWMEALTSRRKKRGSAFAARSKKMGTQYSMSQELQVTRQTQ